MLEAKTKPAISRQKSPTKAAPARPAGVVNPLWRQLALASSSAPSGQASLQRKPIKDTPLASKLKSFSLKLGAAPEFGREISQNPQLLRLGMRPLTAEATAQFTSQADVANLEFGFFQLGRPYELYRATMRKMAVAPAAANEDLNLDLTGKLRAQLPQLDHSIGARFFESTGKPLTAKADASGKVQLKYSDQLSTLFDTEIQKGGQFYGLSGIAAQSFLFTAFGAWDGSDATILGTFYWDLKHCEAVTPGDLKKPKTLGKVNVAPVRSCAQGGCDLGEPFADQFGQAAKKSYLGVVASILEPPSGALGSPSSYDGPGNFSVSCGGPAKKAKVGEND